MKLKIFISSVQREFAEERRMLVDYIRRDPLLGSFFSVFLFEDSPAADVSAENLYLPEVEASDIYLGIIGGEYGNVDSEALNWAGYVERSGNGTESIVRRCLDAGLPKPEYHPDNVDFKAVIWRNPARLGAVGAQLGRSQGAVGAQSGRSQGAVGAKSPREKCLVLLVESELKRKEIADGVGMPSRSGYLSRLLAELVGDGLIERTIPDKPNSSQQRYRLTEKGRTVVGSCIPHNDLS